MDIFALPEVFLQDLLKTMEIKDRLRLRLTCRAFEKLVAETHAGYFYFGGIRFNHDNSFSFYIGYPEFNFETTEAGFRECIELRNRLFTGVELTAFSLINLDDFVTLEFVREFILNFKMTNLDFTVNCQRQLEISRQLMSDFPLCKFTMDLHNFPDDIELLKSLPPMESLTILDYTEYANPSDPLAWEIDSDLFFKLLSKQKCLSLNNVVISSDDCDRIVEIFSTDREKRYVQIKLKKSIVANWLKSHGISSNYKKGDRHGKFEVVTELAQRKNMQLLYNDSTSVRSCLISITAYVWEEGVTHILINNTLE